MFYLLILFFEYLQILIYAIAYTHESYDHRYVDGINTNVLTLNDDFPYNYMTITGIYIIAINKFSSRRSVDFVNKY